ncbi:hypothetical protein SISSUDRAFT_1067346 [Sistotremastrum suecicum HHB10207 ss-3]|uniref:Uncharacterized protein n=1 Tax=Sistotremastrum suecicum HHB10207 ss-3 TaxID=1314776 RepID=A0A165X805_9AGAM|nr:hypothetical protein SISSUDRAFT_1067346 [Sistotremastrum suecicum HHB10207 ss-3]
MPIPVDTLVWRLHKDRPMILESPHPISRHVLRLGSITLESGGEKPVEVFLRCQKADIPGDPDADAPSVPIARFGSNPPYTLSFSQDIVLPELRTYVYVKDDTVVTVFATWYDWSVDALALGHYPHSTSVPSEFPTKAPANGASKQLPKRKLTESTAEAAEGDDESRKRIRVPQLPSPPALRNEANPAPPSASASASAPTSNFTPLPIPVSAPHSTSNRAATSKAGNVAEHAQMAAPSPEAPLTTVATSFQTATTSFDGNSRYPIVLSGGLRYRIVVEADGREMPKTNELVRVKQQTYVGDQLVDKNNKLLFRIGTGLAQDPIATDAHNVLQCNNGQAGPMGPTIVALYNNCRPCPGPYSGQ